MNSNVPLIGTAYFKAESPVVYSYLVPMVIILDSIGPLQTREPPVEGKHGKEGEKMETGKRTKNEWRGGEMIEKIRKR